MTFNTPTEICPAGANLLESTQEERWHDARGLLEQLLQSSIIRKCDWDHLNAGEKEALVSEMTEENLLADLVLTNLITDYQSKRIQAGQQFGLILGNYRILDRLGHGAMGQVYKAEHIRLPRIVAIKIPNVGDSEPELLRRFENEAWSLAQLEHRHIVRVIDAGRQVNESHNGDSIPYAVMEYVPGKNLHDLVSEQGALSVEMSCQLISQIASALEETSRIGMIHRDIKPSNIIVTPDCVAKLLDFGLSRQWGSCKTNPGSWLGTFDYLAPEQAQDASSVNVRADIYSLGATLYWCLTGQTPFNSTGFVLDDFLRRLQQDPPCILKVNPELPSALSAVVARMMAVDPNDRYQTPTAVIAALFPFLDSSRNLSTIDSSTINGRGLASSPPVPVADDSRSKPRVLIVDDQPNICKLVKLSLISEGLDCVEADSGEKALQLLNEQTYDLVLTDIEMPGISGLELLKIIRNRLPSANLKVLIFSGQINPNEMALMMSAGADDYLAKPLSIVQLRSRVNAALRLKAKQDAVGALNQ